MAFFVVLWSYLLTTKLSCLQKNNFGHTKLGMHISRHDLYGSQSQVAHSNPSCMFGHKTNVTVVAILVIRFMISQEYILQVSAPNLWYLVCFKISFKIKYIRFTSCMQMKNLQIIIRFNQFTLTPLQYFMLKS